MMQETTLQHNWSKYTVNKNPSFAPGLVKEPRMLLCITTLQTPLHKLSIVKLHCTNIFSLINLTRRTHPGPVPGCILNNYVTVLLQLISKSLSCQHHPKILASQLTHISLLTDYCTSTFCISQTSNIPLHTNI